MEIDGFAYQLLQAETGLPYAEHVVLEREHSHHMVKVAVGNGIGLEEVLLYGVANLPLVHLLVEPDYVAPEGHYGVDLEVAQGEHALHYVLFDRGNFPFVGTLLDYRLDLLLGDLRLLALDSEYLYHEPRALGKQPHERRDYGGNHLHRAGDGLGDAF